MSVLWFCWGGVPIIPHAPPGKYWPHKEPLCPGQSWAGNHVPGVWPSILIHDPSWHFPAPGNPNPVYSLQRPGLGEGHGTPGTQGLSWCGGRLAGGIRTQCPNAVVQRARRSLCCLASGPHRGLAGNTTGHVSVSLVARKGLYARILPLKLRAVLCGLG